MLDEVWKWIGFSPGMSTNADLECCRFALTGVEFWPGSGHWRSLDRFGLDEMAIAAVFHSWLDVGIGRFGRVGFTWSNCRFGTADADLQEWPVSFL
ncbi:hypothetical protein Nepgr_028932 [Nepenthes gracilis]|uniref:Uncharacterized protein n=1 Tax=Nepenthes gracilis TaxID=150966 RepID=A0AAD3Y4I9_NEPGR|nr:hypothetical protein Nepgr_028932 [Nepenthes gracilis]